MPAKRAVRLSTGYEVPLDGDLLAIIEALYQEITLGNNLASSFETMRAEIVSLIEQMTDAERRDYLAESLFLNSVTYENEMLSAYVRRLASPQGRTSKTAGSPEGRARSAGKRKAPVKAGASRKNTKRKKR